MITMNLDIANNMMTFLISVATLIIFMVGAIGWFIRHEVELKYLRRDHEEKTGALDARQILVENSMKELKDGIQFKIDTLQVGITSISNQISHLMGRLEEMSKRDRKSL